MIEPSRAEAGCIAFGLYVDPADPSRMALLEEWVDAAALQEHSETS